MSSSSEEDIKQKSKKGGSKNKVKGEDYQILPSKGGATLETSSWPLLLKV